MDMETHFVNRPEISCKDMERICPNIYEPILNIPWCATDGEPGVSPRDFVRPGDINDIQCYSLPLLINAIETDMERNPGDEPRDIFRTPIESSYLLKLCAQYVHNGGVLPPLLGAHVYRLLNHEVPAPAPDPNAVLRHLAYASAEAVLLGWTRRDWETRNSHMLQASNLFDIDIIPIIRLSAARLARLYPLPIVGNSNADDLRNLFLNIVWQHYNLPEAERLIVIPIPEHRLRVSRADAIRPPTRHEAKRKK